jgi:hypothetical protein
MCVARPKPEPQQFSRSNAGGCRAAVLQQFLPVHAAACAAAVLQRVAVCCNVLQPVAACCSPSQRVAACCSVTIAAACRSVAPPPLLQCGAIISSRTRAASCRRSRPKTCAACCESRCATAGALSGAQPILNGLSGTHAYCVNGAPGAYRRVRRARRHRTAAAAAAARPSSAGHASQAGWTLIPRMRWV